MARALRVDAPGTFHHVYNRGARKRFVFLDDHDRRRFLYLLGQAVRRTDAKVHAYCLMGNHFHLLVESTNGNLSTLMHHVSCRYVRYFNRRHGFDGPLFTDRFKSKVIADDQNLLAVARYIHQNPTDVSNAPLVQYRWSSYGSYIGARKRPDWLTTKLVFSFFGADRTVFAQHTEDEHAHSQRPSFDNKASLVDRPERVGPEHWHRTMAQLSLVVSSVLDVPLSTVATPSPGAESPPRMLACYLASQFLAIPNEVVAGHLNYASGASVQRSSNKFRVFHPKHGELAEAIDTAVETIRRSTWELPGR
jgi:REP element-mobilizing transposase RayT